MSLKYVENDNSQVVGAARRKSRFPRKILRVILSDGTCMLQPQINGVKVKEDWNYYSEGTAYKDNGHDLVTSHHDTKDQPVKVSPKLDAHHDTENAYFNSNKSLSVIDDNKFKMGNLMLLNTRLPPTDVPPIAKFRETLRPHKHQHPEPTPEFPYQCDTCDMLFKTIDFLNDHQNTVHHNNRQFACRYCSKRFNDKYNMRKHVLIHVGEKRHKCQFCQKAFLRKDHLRSHLQTHYNRKFGCKICSKSFRTLDLYQKHAKTHKETPSFSFVSNAIKSHADFGKVDSSIIENNLDVQMKKEHGETPIDNSYDTPNISNVTSQSTKELGAVKEEQYPVTILDDDFNERWRNGPSMLGNESCRSKTPNGTKHDELHMNGISPKSQGFHCTKCSATFKTDVSLQMHSQRCNGNPRQWQCIKCNIIFDEAKTLKQHYEKVHSDGKPTPNPSRWRCKTCEINYPNSKELSRHYAQAHKDAQIFPCSECPKTFTVWHNLKKHMLIHLGDKKHKCGVCNKGFVRKDHLNSHMKVHLGDGSKFTCPVCCKVFRLKQMYLKHVNLHGLEKACDEKEQKISS